jgi:hypothetical protein
MQHLARSGGAAQLFPFNREEAVRCAHAPCAKKLKWCAGSGGDGSTPLSLQQVRVRNEGISMLRVSHLRFHPQRRVTLISTVV